MINETTNRDVLIASNNEAQIARVRRALERVFASRPEKITWHQATSVFGALQVIGRLEKTLVPLVVTSGFDGQWFEVLGRAQEVAADQIVAIMMTGNEQDQRAALAFRMHSISTMFDEEEMAALAADLLFGNLHDYDESPPRGSPLEPDTDLETHSA